jgi:hypothetical protein
MLLASVNYSSLHGHCTTAAIEHVNWHPVFGECITQFANRKVSIGIPVFEFPFVLMKTLLKNVCSHKKHR